VVQAAALAVVASVFVQATPQAHADEGGGSFWVPGQSAANLAATMPSPGWSVPATYYFYSGDAPAAASSGPGVAVGPGTQGRTSTLTVSPTYVPSTTVLGAQVALTVSFGVGSDATRIPPTTPPGVDSQTVRGATDVAPAITLGWQHGAEAWSVYLTGNVPVGSYELARLSNVGLGRAAVDGGVVYTYEDATSSRSFSVAGGVTYNFINRDTDYRSGVDAHLGVSAMLPVGDTWRAGLTGYLYYQLTGDSGSGNTCGPCKSRVAGVGPQVSATFPVAGQSWSLDVRGYREFRARNRLEGYAVFAVLDIPLAAPTGH
jgi:hypothetical protein